MRFLWGYLSPGSQPEGQVASRERLVEKYRAKVDLRAENEKAWKMASLQFASDEPSLAWVGRELLWHNYMLRAGTTFDDFFGEYTINQASSYLYSAGLNAAARDPLQHVLPLIATRFLQTRILCRLRLNRFSLKFAHRVWRHLRC